MVSQPQGTIQHLTVLDVSQSSQHDYNGFKLPQVTSIAVFFCKICLQIFNLTHTITQFPLRPFSITTNIQTVTFAFTETCDLLHPQNDLTCHDCFGIQEHSHFLFPSLRINAIPFSLLLNAALQMIIV